MRKLLLTAGIAILATACKEKIPVYTVQQRTLNEAVYASGEIMPQAYYFLKFNSADLLLQVKVKEGDAVNRDQVLAVLGTPSQLTQSDILHRQVALAGSNAEDGSATLNELKERIEQARQKYEADNLNAARYTDLAKDKAVSEKDAEQTRLEAANSLHAYRSLQQQYLAQKNALALGCGHCFIVFMTGGFPINILNAIKAVPEVCAIYCATANPVEVIVADTGSGRGILGVIDGVKSKGIETESDVEVRKEMLRKFGYKL